MHVGLSQHGSTGAAGHGHGTLQHGAGAGQHGFIAGQQGLIGAAGQHGATIRAAGQHGVASGAAQRGPIYEYKKDWDAQGQAAKLGKAPNPNTKNVPTAINCFFMTRFSFFTRHKVEVAWRTAKLNDIFILNLANIKNANQIDRLTIFLVPDWISY